MFLHFITLLETKTTLEYEIITLKITKKITVKSVKNEVLLKFQYTEWNGMTNKVESIIYYTYRHVFYFL